MTQDNQPVARKFEILPRIYDPADVRRLTPAQMRRLAAEIRARIIETLSRISGHFGASMGAVELTLALHAVLDTPRDQIVWDVGHQAYAHKIITGRNDRFDTIRRTGGLSGFLRREESEYDAFGAGHASTSISAALGMAKARDLKGEDYRVCAVIGDGSMTGGLAFEAINNLGSLNADMLIVLNDNEMSITRNVGALARYFNRLITDHFYNETKGDIKELIQSIPAVGQRLVHLTHKVESGAKHLIVPGKFFEDLGVRYIGPLDGHDLESLMSTLERVKDLKGPNLLHVITRKGQGYEKSERDPVRWHSPGQFEPETGAIRKKNGPPAYTDVFSRAIVAEGERHSNLVTVTAAMAPGVGLEAFAERHPERFFDVGIAEGHAVTFAAGLAARGALPVVCIYSTFLQRAYDNILHDVALQGLKVVFCIDRAGLVGEDGPTHHGLYDLTYLRSIPGMTVMAPRDEGELVTMLRTAVDVCDGPVAIRYPRGAGEGVATPDDPEPIEIGRAEILRRGEDIAILAIGRMTNVAMEAAALLAREEGLDVGVVNARFVKPLDRDALAGVARSSKRLFSLEDNTVAGGFGSAVNEALVDMDILDRPCVALGPPDRFIPHGEMCDLLGTLELTPEGVARQIVERLRRAARAAKSSASR